MKIAFIVQMDWMTAHFGVRNLFISLFKILEQKGHDVHFVWFWQNYNKILFYRNIVNDKDLKSNIKRTTLGTNKNYNELVENKNNSPETYTQFLGESIKDSYDAFILTNPWLLVSPLDLGDKKKCLICHDCGANSLNILNLINVPEWGYAHNVGYQFAKNNDYHFLSNSEKTNNEIKEYYNPKQYSFLPPVPTYAFMDIEYSSEQVKENAIVLAAPFDPRKGLEKIPKYLNKLQSDFDTLYIYGTPRCDETLYKKFYKELNVKNVVYYNQITSDDLIKLYKKCKILFFPSREEGLGIPIIEAQLCGCRVVTTNEKPMNQLVCDGAYLLTNDIETDIDYLREMLKDGSFDYSRLSNLAKEKFSAEKIYKELMDILQN